MNGGEPTRVCPFCGQMDSLVNMVFYPEPIEGPQGPAVPGVCHEACYRKAVAENRQFAERTTLRHERELKDNVTAQAREREPGEQDKP